MSLLTSFRFQKSQISWHVQLKLKSIIPTLISNSRYLLRFCVKYMQTNEVLRKILTIPGNLVSS